MSPAHGETGWPSPDSRTSHDFVNTSPKATDATLYRASEAPGETVDEGAEVVASRHNQLGGGRWRWCSDVGH
jgi:hypothetical protein